jgi:hypothetical protein
MRVWIGTRSRLCCADDGLMSWVKGLEQEEPDVAMTADDAADLGRCRRGVEPLRIVVMPQHYLQATNSPVIGPMHVVV